MAPPRYDVPNAAPAPLRLVQELVNTTDHEHGREWLSEPAELRRWLRERKLVEGRTRVGPRELARTLEVREALRALLIAHNTGERQDEALAILNKVADRSRLGAHFDERGVELRPHARGVDGALGEILRLVAAAIGDGSWNRLKACRNCHWAFYDYSRNRSATWCSMQLCGNRLKTRAYRRRATPQRRRTAG